MTNLQSALAKIRLFEPLDDSTRRQLVKKMEARVIEAGDFLFHMGDESDGMYIVEDGALNIFFGNPNPLQEDIVVTTATAGDVLGEISLLDKQNRAASVKAIAKSTVRHLSAEAFAEVIASQPKAIIDNIREISERMRLDYMLVTLRRLDIFQGMQDEHLEHLIEHIQRHTLRKGEVLFEKGDSGDQLYIVNSGWLDIYVSNPGGEDLILNQCGPGEAIGEIALLDDAPRTASVRGVTDAYLFTLGRDAYIDFITKYPKAALETTRAINGRLRLATTYLEQLSEWSRQVAEGHYERVLKEIKSEQTRAADDETLESRVTRFLSSFFSSIEAVKEREEKLKSEVLRLRIQIDETKREEDVETITNTNFFTELQTNIGELRKQLRDEIDNEESSDS